MLEVVFEEGEDALFVEEPEFGKDLGEIVGILLEGDELDLVDRLVPPAYVLDEGGELEEPGGGGDQEGLLLEQLEEEGGRGDLEGELLLLAEEVVEPLVEVVDELLLRQPAQGRPRVIRPQQDVRKYVAHVNARRLVEATG